MSCWAACRVNSIFMKNSYSNIYKLVVMEKSSGNNTHQTNSSYLWGMGQALRWGKRWIIPFQSYKISVIKIYPIGIYFLHFYFIPEEDSTFLYLEFILVKRISYQTNRFCSPTFTYNYMLGLVLSVSKHSYTVTILPPICWLYKCVE